MPEKPCCHATRDGDCTWSWCPQVRDGEPERSHRHCPLDAFDDELNLRPERAKEYRAELRRRRDA